MTLLKETCSKIVVPLMAAMAELIGYDEILPEELLDEPAWEGAEKQSVITRRERNPTQPTSLPAHSQLQLQDMRRRSAPVLR